VLLWLLFRISGFESLISHLFIQGTSVDVNEEELKSQLIPVLSVKSSSAICMVFFYCPIKQMKTLIVDTV